MPSNPVATSNQILVYPQDAKYSRNLSTYYSQANQYTLGAWVLPTPLYQADHTYHRGDYNLQDWSGTGGDGQTDVTSGSPEKCGQIWRQEPVENTQQGHGFWYKLETSANGKVVTRWFDIGDLPGTGNNATIDLGGTTGEPKSSWLQNVTGLWFIFDGKGTTETRDCYASIDQAALRYLYKDSNGKLKHIVLHVTEKIGNISYGDVIRGNTSRIFGYQLSSAQVGAQGNLRDFVRIEKCQLIGARVQLKLRRGSSGTKTDTIKAQMHGMRFSLGDAKLNSEIDTTKTKMAIVGSATTEYSQQDLNKFYLEMGKY